MKSHWFRKRIDRIDRFDLGVVHKLLFMANERPWRGWPAGKVMIVSFRLDVIDPVQSVAVIFAEVLERAVWPHDASGQVDFNRFYLGEPCAAPVPQKIPSGVLPP